MFSVHYKFKATLEYKTLTFDGLHIGVDELKKAICDKENIRTESFDLLLTNAHTKREYAVGELVPRNSSVVVQRIPRENAQKLPKVHDTSTSGLVVRNVSLFQNTSSTYINPEEFAGMSEEQRLAHIKRVSTEKYSTTNYQRRTGGIMTGPPPATYVCNRCGQPGHWYKSCPLLNLRRTAGITMEELMETDRDDPLAMLHPSGKFVKPIMHHQARMQRKHEPFPGQPDESRSPGQQPSIISAVPEQFRCRLCGGILRDAVLSACCGHSFCAECYQQQLLTHPTELCPGPECVQQISADSLVPNKMLRDAVQKYLILGIGALEQPTTTPPPPTSSTTIGTNATAVTATTTTTSAALLSAATAQEQRQQQQTPPPMGPMSGGVNKPSVLTDTHSLLHKLLPGLAAAQAQRELETTAKPTPSAAAPEAMPLQQQPLALPSCAVAAQTTTTAPSACSTPPSTVRPGTAAVQLAALFDPNRPPPTLTPEMISAAGPTTAQPPPPSAAATVTAPTTTLISGGVASGGGGAILPPPMYSTPTMALSAEDSLSVWENFLKRKENEKAERNFQLMRNSGGGGGGGSSANYQQHQKHHRTEHRGDYHHRDRDYLYHKSRKGEGGRSGTARREEQNEGEREGSIHQPKMTVEEKSTVWKLFEKHYEKKEGAKVKQPEKAERKRGKQGEPMKKEGNECRKNEERRKDDGRKDADKNEDGERRETERKKDDGRKDGERKEGGERGQTERKKDDGRKDGERKEDGERGEKRKDDGRKEEERTEGRERGEIDRKKDDSRKEEERTEGRERGEIERKKDDGIKDGERKEGGERGEAERNKDDGEKEAKKKRDNEREGQEKKEPGAKGGERREQKEENDGKKKEKDEREKERKRKKDDGRKDGERKDGGERGETERKKDDGEREAKKKRDTEREGKEKKEHGGRGSERREQKEENGGQKKEKNEREKERDGKKDDAGREEKRLFASPSTAAVNQLDITLAQEETIIGWRTGRLRHAPLLRSPPNFEDTNRWRPLPEVQVRTESPANIGDVLFIDMGRGEEKEQRKEDDGKEKEGRERRKEGSDREKEQQKDYDGREREERDQRREESGRDEKRRKRSKKQKKEKRKRHYNTSDSEANGTEISEKRRRKHKKEKKSKRERTERE